MTTGEDALIESMNGHYAELRLDGAAWAEDVDERESWEATLANGLASARWPGHPRR